MDLDKISNLIKTKRKEKGLTQLELAEKLNVTEKAISRWETGRGTPDISLLIPLAKALDLDVSELLNGKENKKEEKHIEEIINYIEMNKKTKNKFIIPIAIVGYAIVLFLYLGYLKIEYSVGTGHSYFGEIIINSIFAIFIYLINKMIANTYYDKKEEKDKVDKITNIIFLIMYCILFFNLTILGRTTNGEIRYNLIPFKTIFGYFKYLDWYDIKINLIGNFIILMPLQYLLMRIYNIKKFKHSLYFNLILVTSVEILQHATHTGVLDIDDIILNVSGMSIVYYIFKNNRFNIKNTVKVIIPFITLCGIFYGTSKYIEYNNINKVGNIINSEIIIKDNTIHDEILINNIASNMQDRFKTEKYKGCTLLKIEYDEKETRNREEELSKELQGQEVIMISFTFKTGKKPSNNLKPNTIYEYYNIYSIDGNSYELISKVNKK